jgi:hypothetical protein
LLKRNPPQSSGLEDAALSRISAEARPQQEMIENAMIELGAEARPAT